MRKLYRFTWTVLRAEDVEGMFVADDSLITRAMGMDISFGPIVSDYRHNVRGYLGEQDLEVLSEDQERIDWLVSIRGNGNTISGYNPLEYLVDGAGYRIQLVEQV